MSLWLEQVFFLEFCIYYLYCQFFKVKNRHGSRIKVNLNDVKQENFEKYK